MTTSKFKTFTLLLSLAFVFIKCSQGRRQTFTSVEQPFYNTTLTETAPSSSRSKRWAVNNVYHRQPHYGARPRGFSRGRSQSASSGSFLQNLLGVEPECSKGREIHECVLTPSCWMAGGKTVGGCDSVLYSCCIMPNKPPPQRRRSRHNNFLSRRLKHHPRNSNAISADGGFGHGDNLKVCGISSYNAFSKRIIGGVQANFAELPWQVHIRISNYQCGGVLLNEFYIATAAHCVHQAKKSSIQIYLGEYDTKNAKVYDAGKEEKFEARTITLHPKFKYMLTQPDRYDIALIRLDRPVTFRENVAPICLPTIDYDLDNKVGLVAGWGKTDNSFGKTGTNILHKVLVPIIANDKCQKWHQDKAIFVNLHDEMFCAGYADGKHDACLGDSGGPLVINFDGRWTLVGITSAGFGCAVAKQPGIYHKVSKTARWIAQQISKH